MKCSLEINRVGDTSVFDHQWMSSWIQNLNILQNSVALLSSQLIASAEGHRLKCLIAFV